ncbi:hypothetical protein C0993_002971 [Termitomyces sp. T159_Od127]|nr:hypothetical protein C0993_002971 [Termitomyces sp. T159_Od127]
MLQNSKRHRASSSQDSSSSTETQYPTKSSRTVTGQAGLENSHPLVCTLPPTCNHKPTPLANSRELEAHYATYHAHVCEQHGCGTVFPEARLLELFACHLASCARLFSTPKTRRLHLIQAHGYPKEYFFAVTNKGIGGLLKKWGEGASMIRGQWKRRETSEDNEGSGDEDNDNIDVHDDRIVDDTGHTDPNPQAKHGIHVRDYTKTTEHTNADEILDGLIDNMESLSLVPPSVRFGRGGKKGGFIPNSERGDSGDSSSNRGNGYRGRGRGGRGRGRGGIHHASTEMNIDSQAVPASQRSLGRTGRGRARSIRVHRAGKDGILPDA